MIQDYLLEPLRKVSFKLQKDKNQRWYSQTHLQRSSDITAGKIIYDVLTLGKPAMISRLGTSELHIILNYLSRKQQIPTKFFNYLNGTFPEFWWGNYAREDIFKNSGVFPNNKENLERFTLLYLDNISQIDVLLTWLRGEKHLDKYFSHNIQKTFLYDCEPYFDKELPWTSVLEHKKILVIHPFEDSIKDQYEKRKLLFSDERVLPDFELKTIKAYQTVKGNTTSFDSWFTALDALKEKINKIDFDIALIGAGAYGLPLAAHVKSMGKQGVHLGGFLQFIFGIRGARWENCYYHQPFINDHWKFPYKHEYTIGYKKQDKGAYWGKDN